MTQVKVVNDSNGNVNKSRSNYRCKIDNIKGVIFPGEIKEHHYPKWQKRDGKRGGAMKPRQFDGAGQYGGGSIDGLSVGHGVADGRSLFRTR